ncbi:aromatase/cyclase [Streptomyces sioyaensis]|uniref:aromatase/cyclase n=1 Tax=Streptomyces sioyaensis TaxID=67364 RepID=UPI0037D79A5A
MSVPPPHRTLHRIAVAAPAEVVYGIVADVTKWPQYFAPNVHVEYLERDEGSERIHMWALANCAVKHWVSRRILAPAALSVSFRQEVSAPPVAAMGGAWVVSPVDDGSSLLELHHDFAAVDNDPAGIEWITAAVDRNSADELAGIKEIAERYQELDDLVFSFEDTVEMDADATDVFDFLDRADLWPERLPHVTRLAMTEDEPGVQVIAMDTCARDGSTHTTESVRVVFGPDRIVYKQTTVPGLMTAHTGSWTIVPDADGVAVTSRHTVTLKPSAVESILGAGKTVADAREYVHKALSTNSTNTLKLAKAHAEALRG